MQNNYTRRRERFIEILKRWRDRRQRKPDRGPVLHPPALDYFQHFTNNTPLTPSIWFVKSCASHRAAEPLADRPKRTTPKILLLLVLLAGLAGCGDSPTSLTATHPAGDFMRESVETIDLRIAVTGARVVATLHLVQTSGEACGLSLPLAYNSQKLQPLAATEGAAIDCERELGPVFQWLGFRRSIAVADQVLLGCSNSWSCTDGPLAVFEFRVLGGHDVGGGGLPVEDLLPAAGWAVRDGTNQPLPFVVLLNGELYDYPDSPPVVSFEWDAPTAGEPALAYTVERGTPGASFTPAGIVTANEVTFYDWPLTPVALRVAGVDAQGRVGIFSEPSDPFPVTRAGGRPHEAI